MIRLKGKMLQIQQLMKALYIVVHKLNFLLIDLKYGVFLKTKIKQNPYDYISKNSISNDGIMRNTANSWYSLMQTVSGLGMVITIMVCGLVLAFTKNPQKREEVKKKLIVKAGVFIIICAFAWFVGTIFSAVNKMG